MNTHIVEGEFLEAAQAGVSHVFRTWGLPDTHATFEWQDLDDVRDSLGGILVTTRMDAD